MAAIAAALFGVAGVVAAAGALLVLALVGRDPDVAPDGSLAAPGLSAPAKLLRDPFGIPHVLAATFPDACFALGVAHAQDRLWQMELSRRGARGRLSELFGESALGADRLARTLGFGEAAKAELPKLSRDTHAVLEAYSAGVNAWLAEIAANRAARPFELRWLAVEPEPWTPEDSLAIARLRAFSLSRSLSASLLLDRLVTELGGVPSRDFFPVRPSDGAHDPLGEQARHRDGADAALALLAALGGEADQLASAVGLGGAAGSLGMVLPASRSKSGKPLLANDPHVAFGAPAVFYMAHVRAGRFDLSGATWPGLPVFYSGSNRALAFGQVALHASVSDLFDETLDPSDARRYERGGRWRRASVRRETIAVRGGSPVELEVLTTGHGPLLRSIWPDEPRASALALRFTGQAERSDVESLLRLQRCGDWECFRGSLRELRAPAATFLYADSAGAIGTQLAGDLPIRTLDTGLLPVAGASRFYDWRGFVPFDELPSSYGANLPALVVSPHPDAASFRHPVTWLWSSQGGAERLRELLAREGAFDLEEIVALQRDTTSRRGPAALRLLLAGATPTSSSAQRVLAQLESWDGSTGVDSVGASLYHVFRQRLARGTLEGLGLSEGSRALLAQAEPAPGIVLARALERIDREKTSAARDAALDETWSYLRSAVSANPKKWGWGELHALRLRHAFERLGGGPLGFVGRRLGVGPFAVPGDPDSPWTMYGGELPDRALELGPALRYAVDLADPDHALFGLAGGQSGNPGSEHYADALADWLAGRPRPLWMHASDVSYHRKGTWELRPADP